MKSQVCNSWSTNLDHVQHTHFSLWNLLNTFSTYHVRSRPLAFFLNLTSIQAQPIEYLPELRSPRNPIPSFREIWERSEDSSSENDSAGSRDGSSSWNPRPDPDTAGWISPPRPRRASTNRSRSYSRGVASWRAEPNRCAAADPGRVICRWVRTRLRAPSRWRSQRDTLRSTWAKKTATFTEFWCPWFTSTIPSSVSFWKRPSTNTGSSTRVGSPYPVRFRTLRASRPGSLPGRVTAGWPGNATNEVVPLMMMTKIFPIDCGVHKILCSFSGLLPLLFFSFLLCKSLLGVHKYEKNFSCSC